LQRLQCPTLLYTSSTYIAIGELWFWLKSFVVTPRSEKTGCASEP